MLLTTLYMKHVKTLLALILLCTGLSAFGQGQITGKITDAQTKEPLVGATVVIKPTQKYAISQKDGSFRIKDIKKGVYTITISYVSYETRTFDNTVIEDGQTVTLNVALRSDATLGELVVETTANKESELKLLRDQRRAQVAIEAIGNIELSRKGIGDAEGAVSQLSGMSKKEGEKNIYVRGLPDRYTMTTLNGFPLPSEDPEYKNISLNLFDIDMLQSVEVSKVFTAGKTGDMGGALINLRSRELQGDFAADLKIKGGYNSTLKGQTFYQPYGSDYFGQSDKRLPEDWDYASKDFKKPKEEPAEGLPWPFFNPMKPREVKHPINHGVSFTLGKRFYLSGDQATPLTLLIVGDHSVGYSWSDRTVRVLNNYFHTPFDLHWEGPVSTTKTNQILLANATLRTEQGHRLAYNFLAIHSNNQYYAKFAGADETYFDDYGSMRQTRQQINEHLLVTHQLDTDWRQGDNVEVNAGMAYNRLISDEPDRRKFFMVTEWSDEDEKDDVHDWEPIRGDSNDRFWSTMLEHDLNAKASVTAHFGDKGSFTLGYLGRYQYHKFGTMRFQFQSIDYEKGFKVNDIDSFSWDDILTPEAFTNAVYHPNEWGIAKNKIRIGNNESYDAFSVIHSPYLEAVLPLNQQITLQGGMRMDLIDRTVVNYLDGRAFQNVYTGDNPHVMKAKPQFLPNLNLRYAVTDDHILRLSYSENYTLPRFKELSTYKYITIDGTVHGNSKIKTSQNKNIDFNYDWHISGDEILSFGIYYKEIKNPIGKLFTGTSANYTEYINLADEATVRGVELTLKKDLINRYDLGTEQRHLLRLGLNGAYQDPQMYLGDVAAGIENRMTRLPGASEWVCNADLHYAYSNARQSYSLTLLYNYFSDRIAALGTISKQKDRIEKGRSVLDLVAEAKLTKWLSFKFKASNLIDSPYVVTQEFQSSFLDDYDKAVANGKELPSWSTKPPFDTISVHDPITVLKYKTGRKFSLTMKISF